MGEDSILNASLRICRKGQILVVPHIQCKETLHGTQADVGRCDHAW